MKELRDITERIFLLFNLVAMDDSREEFDLDDLVPDDFHTLFLDEEFTLIRAKICRYMRVK
jgi:hypothetical protein